MLNLKNNPIPTLSLRRQSILKEFNLLTLALALKGKPNSLKDYNDLNKVDIDKVDIDNILSFINYIIIDK
jgi:hypothetical protein